MSAGNRNKSSRGRKVHDSEYSRYLSSLIVKYPEDLPGLSPDTLNRVVSGGGRLNESQIQVAIEHFEWTPEQVERLMALSGDRQGGAFVGADRTCFNPADTLHRRVGELFEAAGFVVREGIAILSQDISVHLGPLLKYLTALQGSAVVPSQFAEGGLISLDELYVELMASENQRSDNLAGQERMTRADPIEGWRTRSRRHRIPLATLLSHSEVLPAVLFGDPGSGKSTLLYFALHEVARSLARSPSLGANVALPFRISLADLARNGQADNFDLIPYIVRRILRVPEPETAVWRAVLGHLFRNVRPFRLLLLLDGVDEVTPHAQVFASIRAKLKDATSIARMVITSRRAGFSSPVDGYAAFELVELAEPAMLRLVNNWFTHVKPRDGGFVQSFTLWLFGDSRRLEMAANPCLLSLLCYLNQDRAEDDFIQTVSRADLYRQAVRKLSGDPDRGLPVDSTAAQEALGRFAFDRYTTSSGTPSVLFTRAEVDQFFHEAGAGDGAAPQAGRTDYLETVWLRTRLVSCWDGGDYYHFVHLSFQEYFAACWLRMLPTTEVGKLLERHRFDPHWQEVWRFYAGLCQALGPRGEARFKVLARAYCEPRDFYDQCLFWLAPLCAEYGLRDTRPLLGFDLRVELQRLILTGHNDGNAFIRRMVEVDPEYFLDAARVLLDRQVALYRVSPGQGKQAGAPDEGEVRLMVNVLSAIYHPRALDYQRELIRAEVHYARLKPTHPSLGPASISGRNEVLTKALRDWLSTAAGPLQRERLVNYLSCTGGQHAAEAILQAARSASAPRSGAVRGRLTQEQAIEFRCHCLWALTELQDKRAVDLADELWQEARFRSGLAVEACNFLGDLKLPEVPELLERWLADPSAGPNRLLLEPILLCLKDWAERPVPDTVERLLASEDGDPSVRAYAWEVLVRRSGIDGLCRLRKHLADLAEAPRWTEKQLRELVAVVGFVGEERLPLERELEALLERAEESGEDLVIDALWACLTQWHGDRARLPSHWQWFKERCLPALRLALTRTEVPPETTVSNWLASLRGCPDSVRTEVARLVEDVWPSVQVALKPSLLNLFTEAPEFAPAAVVREVMADPEASLRQSVLLDMLAQVEPGWLVALRAREPEADRALLRRSIVYGTLFFDTGFWEPRDLSFQPYPSISDPHGETPRPPGPGRGGRC